MKKFIISIIYIISILCSQDFHEYKMNSYGMKEKVRTYSKNYLGGYDVYEYNNYGMKVKVGTVDKIPN